MKRWSNKIGAANAGWPPQFRFRGLCHWTVLFPFLCDWPRATQSERCLSQMTSKPLLSAGLAISLLGLLEFGVEAQETNSLYTVQTNIFETFSPKLGKFLAANSSARI